MTKHELAPDAIYTWADFLRYFVSVVDSKLFGMAVRLRSRILLHHVPPATFHVSGGPLIP